jgi:hypothetical protein
MAFEVDLFMWEHTLVYTEDSFSSLPLATVQYLHYLVCNRPEGPNHGIFAFTGVLFSPVSCAARRCMRSRNRTLVENTEAALSALLYLYAHPYIILSYYYVASIIQSYEQIKH